MPNGSLGPESPTIEARVRASAEPRFRSRYAKRQARAHDAQHRRRPCPSETSAAASIVPCGWRQRRVDYSADLTGISRSNDRGLNPGSCGGSCDSRVCRHREGRRASGAKPKVTATLGGGGPGTTRSKQLTMLRRKSASKSPMPRHCPAQKSTRRSLLASEVADGSGPWQGGRRALEATLRQWRPLAQQAPSTSHRSPDVGCEAEGDVAVAG
jgi:hypothetical protein